MIATVVLLVVLLFSLRGLANFYTDYLWFDSLGQGTTWRSLLGAKIAPALVFTVLFFAILFTNLLLADRLAPRVGSTGPPTPEEELIARYREVTGRYARRIRVGIALFFALIAGIGVAAQWQQWILFTHRVDFHVVDPQFHRDIGFYVFELPFIKFIINWLFAGLIIILLITATAHYLNGGIRFQSPHQRVTPQVKAHLSVILALMALVKTAGYYFARFELNFSSRGVVDGATFTDIKAQLPALKLLLVVSVIAAALFVWNIRRRGWVLPVIAAGLWAFLAIVVGAIYPAVVQNLKVKPNEFANEQPYINRNIAATRSAFNLSNVAVSNFDFTTDLQSSVVTANLPTIQNARLWDPNVIQATYKTLQGLQTYYQINEVDVDRYVVDGQVTPVLIAARGLNSSSLPSQSWVNEHLVYTHGYGAVASPANKASTDKTPVFFLSDIPTKASGILLSEKGSEIYFGEDLANYVIVNGKQAEFNYPQSGASDAQTRYNGKDGVKLSNILRKAAFALRFGDYNPLISGQVTSSSKVLMERDIRARVEKLAPFLSFDADPYPVVSDGRLVWVLDGYTTSDAYPYAEQTSGSGGLGGSFNYVRNSVKATVDGYDGTVKLYVVDSKDPITRAYQSAFPGLFTPGSKMPADIAAHLRYPEDLFKVQSNVYAKYHVTNPRRFYQGSERWLLSPDPKAAVGTVSTATTNAKASSSGRATQITATTPRQDPYYLDIRLPGDDRESFLILQPFVPVSQDNQQTRLVSFLTAKSDPRNYGQLQSFAMPQNTSVQGPVQVAANINKDPDIARTITLLGQQGSMITYGNVQLIPVGSSIIYVQPFFISATVGQAFPQFEFVAVYVQGKNPVIADTVQHGLDQIFGGATSSVTTPATTPSTGPTTSTTAPATGAKTVGQILAQAVQTFAQADAALKNGDLATYAQLVKQGEALVTQASQLVNGS
jgi:uncharacterized membrane protein (UPF0182 family)